jgi:hypothetical protein
VDLEFLLTSLYFFVDEWWQRDHPRSPPRPGRPPSLSPSEVLTLAIVAQWPRFRSERDFHSFADAHLREYFPNPHLRPTQPPHPRSGARAKSFPARDVQNTGRRLESLPRAGHHPHSGHRESSCLPQGVVCRQATFGRCASKIEWVCGFKVALSVTPEGVITAFVLAETNAEERPIAEFLVAFDGYDAYLADKGFSSVAWERHWMKAQGALVVATPQKAPDGHGPKKPASGQRPRGNSSKV